MEIKITIRIKRHERVCSMVGALGAWYSRADADFSVHLTGQASMISYL